LNRSLVAAALALALSMSLAQSAGAQASFAAAQPAKRVDYWQQREIDIAAQLAPGQDLSAIRLIFIGDSITDFWLLDDNPWATGVKNGRKLWDESFGPANPRNRALNLGISGDRLEHALYRLQPASAGGGGTLDRADLRPEFIVLMIGINNSWDAEEPADASIFAGVKAVIDSIRARKPDAKIVLQSILPTNAEAKNRAIVRPVNANLAKLAASAPYAVHVRWLDLYPSFVDANGAQIPGYFYDGLHPNDAGYRVWRDRLVPFLEGERVIR